MNIRVPDWLKIVTWLITVPVLLVIGIPGLLDDIATWRSWLDWIDIDDVWRLITAVVVLILFVLANIDAIRRGFVWTPKSPVQPKEHRAWPLGVGVKEIGAGEKPLQPPPIRERRRVLKERLRMARDQGYDMLGAGDPDMMLRWVTHTRDLIIDSLGNDEVALFFSDEGLEDKGMEDIGRRLYRLNDLIDRVDSLRVKGDFI